MAIELKIPDVGESIREVQIGQWLKQEGEHVEQDENVVEVETDKATMELPAPASGVLSQILKREGEPVSVGDVIAYLEEGGAQSAAEKKPRAQDKRAQPEAEEKRKPAKRELDERVPREKAEEKRELGEREPRRKTEEKRELGERIMPAARRALEQYGVSPEQVEATGPGGRLLKEDVERHVRQRKGTGEKPAREGNGARRGASPARPETAALEEVVPMSLIRRRIAQNLVEAQQQAALLTTFNEIDMGQVMQLRRSYRDRFQATYGVKLGIMSFFVKAVIDALQQYPALNAEIRDNNIVYRNYYHIGIAIGGGRGLVVPVLRHAERMGFAEIEKAIGDYGSRAQENKIRPQELEGGTFTISNGGIYGSLLSTPIVNPPQSGVLGMHVIEERPVARDGQVVIRPMMYLALTYDHRIVDGREAVSFLRRIKDVLEEPSRLLLEI